MIKTDPVEKIIIIELMKGDADMHFGLGLSPTEMNRIHRKIYHDVVYGESVILNSVLVVGM